MKKQRSFLRVFVAMTLIASVLVQALPRSNANADQILNRSLTLRAGATNPLTTGGGSRPGAVVRHFFEFDLNSTSLSTNLGSIKFEYCTTAANVGTTGPASQCIAPTGMTDAGMTLSAQAGNTGWTLSNTNTTLPDDLNEFYVTRTAANPSGANTELEFSGITNPTTEGSFYVRITTFATTDTTGTLTDSGTVTASTSEQIILTGTMPESLVFCTGADILLTASVPDCATVTSGAIAFDRLFSSTDTAAARSEMAASTNAGFGYVITVNGTTMTSGSNTITANATPTSSNKGNSQFGMNLVENTGAAAQGFSIVPPATDPAVLSANITLPSNNTNLNGRPLPDYATQNTFTFVPGVIVADSNYDPVAPAVLPQATDSQIYTASYIVNVPGSQPAGTYTTTLTYICTPTF